MSGYGLSYTLKVNFRSYDCPDPPHTSHNVVLSFYLLLGVTKKCQNYSQNKKLHKISGDYYPSSYFMPSVKKKPKIHIRPKFIQVQKQKIQAEINYVRLVGYCSLSAPSEI